MCLPLPWQGGLALGERALSLSHSVALLVYRVFRNEAKRTTKVLHGLLHGFAFIIALVGEFLAQPSLPAFQASRWGHWVLGPSPEVPAS